MSAPVCRAQPQVQSSEIVRIQEDASHRLPASRAVVDTELLSSRELAHRERRICRETGLCEGVANYAARVTRAMRVPGAWRERTQINIRRLFSSHRVTTQEMILLFGFMGNPDQVTAFRNTARILFSSRGELFYYEHVPYQGAVLCYWESREGSLAQATGAK